ncbi:SDR family NAD(P)-dependent oxidoreductase [bacterium]|nr:SDR family NAD(P)-dependent oxidoreductase [bacterium]
MSLSPEEFRTRYGPCALIAGAAVGLGAAYARQLAAHGLDLVLLDRDPVPLAATAAAVRAAHGVAVHELVVDLGRDDVVERVRAGIAGREIGLLVYNAALGTVAPFLAITPAHIDAMLAVNCRAPAQLVHALAPAMVGRGRGGVVLMSSMSGNVGSAQLAMYAASKAFALVFGDALWIELRPHGVDVLVVQPGSTRTPGWESSQPAEGTTLPVMEPADVVREALATLGVEPLIIPGEMNRQGAAGIVQLSRRQAIEFMSQFTAGLLRNDQPAKSTPS